VSNARQQDLVIILRNNFFYTEEEESYVVEHISWIKKPRLYTETAKNIAEKRNKAGRPKNFK